MDIKKTIRKMEAKKWLNIANGAGEVFLHFNLCHVALALRIHLASVTSQQFNVKSFCVLSMCRTQIIKSQLD